MKTFPMSLILSISVIFAGQGLTSSTLARTPSKSIAAKNDKDPSVDSESPYNKTVSNLQKVLSEYYPKAKVKKAPGKFNATFKCRVMNDESGTGRQINAPELGGILIELEEKPGRYSGKASMPSRVNEFLYVAIQMAPYSTSSDKHLSTRILFPTNAPEAVIQRIQDVIEKYGEEGETKPPIVSNSGTGVDTEQSTATEPEESKSSSVSLSVDSKSESDLSTASARLQAPEVVSPTSDRDLDKEERGLENDAVKGTTGIGSESTRGKGKEQQKKIDFGGARLTRYTFPDGEFQINLPGSPYSKAKERGSMRFVEYHYQEPMGSYNIGYTRLPAPVPVQEQDTFLTDLIMHLAKVTKGETVKLLSLPWQGYPGRQAYIKNIKNGDEDKHTKIRVILASRYLYIIQTIGSKPWLDSRAVKDVLSSFLIRANQR